MACDNWVNSNANARRNYFHRPKVLCIIQKDEKSANRVCFLYGWIGHMLLIQLIKLYYCHESLNILAK
jgi:hypothetical protein